MYYFLHIHVTLQLSQNKKLNLENEQILERNIIQAPEPVYPEFDCLNFNPGSTINKYATMSRL